MKLEEIYAWQKAKELAVEIYKLDFDNSDFQKNIRISAQKISIHIAKGFERVTNSDFLRHLYFAQEYSSEIKTLIYIAIDLNIISEEEKDNIFEKLEEVNKLIGGFVKHIKTKIANREKE